MFFFLGFYEVVLSFDSAEWHLFHRSDVTDCTNAGPVLQTIFLSSLRDSVHSVRQDSC